MHKNEEIQGRGTAKVLIMELKGAQRLILQAVQDLQGSSTTFVEDTQIAAHTRMELRDVQNWLVTLEQEGLVSLVRSLDGIRVFIEAKGRLVLKQNAPIPPPSTITTSEGLEDPICEIERLPPALNLTSSWRSSTC